MTTDSTVSAKQLMVRLNHWLLLLVLDTQTELTTHVFGDGTSQGTSSGAVIRITVTSGSIQSFGLTAGTDTTINSVGAGYTFGTVNLGDDFIFSDSSLSSSASLGFW